MAKLLPKAQRVFAENAVGTDVSQYGTLADGAPFTYTKDPKVIQELSNFLDGWRGAIVGDNAPTLQDMNALFYLITYQLAYLKQAGIGEYDTETTYYINSIVAENGILYKSLVDDNLNEVLTDDTKWEAFTLPDASIERVKLARSATQEQIVEFDHTYLNKTYIADTTETMIIGITKSGQNEDIVVHLMGGNNPNDTNQVPGFPYTHDELQGLKIKIRKAQDGKGKLILKQRFAELADITATDVVEQTGNEVLLGLGVLNTPEESVEFMYLNGSYTMIGHCDGSAATSDSFIFTNLFNSPFRVNTLQPLGSYSAQNSDGTWVSIDLQTQVTRRGNKLEFSGTVSPKSFISDAELRFSLDDSIDIDATYYFNSRVDEDGELQDVVIGNARFITATAADSENLVVVMAADGLTNNEIVFRRTGSNDAQGENGEPATWNLGDAITFNFSVVIDDWISF